MIPKRPYIEPDPAIVEAIAEGLPQKPIETNRTQTKYSPQLAALVITHIINGRTINEIEQIQGCPSWEAITKWFVTYPEFAADYIRAREMSADRWESEALHKLRTASTPEEAQIAKAFLDGVKWSLAKRAPKVYGEKLEHSGNIDVNIGLADRLERARQRQIVAQAAKVIEGVVLPVEPPKPEEPAEG